MKQLIALIAVLLLLFGCAMPALPAMPWDAPKPANPPDVVPPQITDQNQTPQNLTNETQAPQEENNETYDETEPEPLDPFANMTPRNVSDRIYDGQFRLEDQSAYPLRIYVIDGGLADSILVNKGEFNMLLDAGNFDATDAFLKSANVKKLNVLVATRDYEGAVAGIYSLLGKYPVEELWENGVTPSSDGLADSLAKARAMGVAIKHPQVGDKWNFSGVEFTALNPPGQRLLGNPDTDAIVLKVSMGRFCTLFLNPTVQERENAVLSSGESLKCEVVTYFKHGEGRPEPSVLMSNVGPEDVIISVGANSLGLPKETTLTRLNISGVRVWRTDERGTIRITNDGFSPYEIAGKKAASSNWTNYFGTSVN